MPVDRPTFSESWYRVADLRPRLRSTRAGPPPALPRADVARHPGPRQQPVLPPERAGLPVRRPCSTAGGPSPTSGRSATSSSATTPPPRARPSSSWASSTPPTCSRPSCRPTPRACSAATASASRREVQGYLMNLLFIRIPLLDPDRFLDRWVGVFGRVFTWCGLVVWAGRCSGRACTSWPGRLRRADRPAPPDMLDPGQPAAAVPQRSSSSRSCHEFGHAFACKQFGRQQRHRRRGPRHGRHVPGLHAPALRGRLQLVGLPQQVAPRRSSGAAGMFVELAIAADRRDRLGQHRRRARRSTPSPTT